VRVDGVAHDSVKLSVTNSGAIPEEMIPHVFDPFRRKSTQQGRESGLGLGLFIVRQIVEAHGGTVEVHSLEEGETTFSVSIPRRPRV
jgi:signal transduction histidine kinase